MPKQANLGYNDLCIFTPRVRLSRGYGARCRVAYGWKKADKAKNVFKWQVVKGLSLNDIHVTRKKVVGVSKCPIAKQLKEGI